MLLAFAAFDTSRQFASSNPKPKRTSPVGAKQKKNKTSLRNQLKKARQKKVLVSLDATAFGTKNSSLTQFGPSVVHAEEAAFIL